VRQEVHKFLQQTVKGIQIALGQLGNPIQTIKFLDALAQRDFDLVRLGFGGKRDSPQKGQVFRGKRQIPNVGWRWGSFFISD
jgi:hypothetical protein